MKSKRNGPLPAHILRSVTSSLPVQKTHVRNNWKGPGSGNYIWRSGDQAARSTSTSLEDTTQPHGAREHEERTGDWTGTVPNRTPWVSAMRDLHSSLI